MCIYIYINIDIEIVQIKVNIYIFRPVLWVQKSLKVFVVFYQKDLSNFYCNKERKTKFNEEWGCDKSALRSILDLKNDTELSKRISNFHPYLLSKRQMASNRQVILMKCSMSGFFEDSK